MYINEHMMDVYINDHLTMKLVCLPQHLTELVLVNDHLYRHPSYVR